MKHLAKIQILTIVLGVFIFSGCAMDQEKEGIDSKSAQLSNITPPEDFDFSMIQAYAVTIDFLDIPKPYRLVLSFDQSASFIIYNGWVQKQSQTINVVIPKATRNLFYRASDLDGRELQRGEILSIN